MIKYNKKFQKRLNITLFNYKHFTEKYIIFESNGTGKEYNISNDQLLFEGEYKNCERNGNGIEYHSNDKVKYIGEYLNGKRNGKGIEYHTNGNFKFEGEYLRGKKKWKRKRILY